MLQQCGEWRLEREIGRGAYGTVYLAAGPGGERAAVKVCRREDVGEERYERELRGAKLYRAIPPQNGLVRMRGLAEEAWGFYTVLDLADDEFGRPLDSPEGYRPKTLARVIDGEKALPLRECVALAISLANGLAALQRHHLLHRDVKPGNVLFVGGRPVLSDPGLVVDESAAVSTVGTPGYIPPERKFTGPAGDIYSLGLTLKAASFGRQLEDLDKGPAMESDTGSALFPAWWRILNKATDPTPTRRYQSAKALVKDLKVLRLKVSFSSPDRKKALRTALLVVALLVIAFGFAKAISAYREYRGMRTYILEKEAAERESIKEVRREAQWVKVGIGFSLADIYKSQVDWHIDQVAATNKTLAAELRALIEKMMALDRKYKALQDAIGLQRDEASRNRKKGLGDEKEFERASGLAKEREKVDKEIKSVYSEICGRLGVGK